jgi:hypothetical protein
MVVENEQLVGILALKDLLRFLATKVELEGEGGTASKKSPESKKDSPPPLKAHR